MVLLKETKEMEEMSKWLKNLDNYKNENADDEKRGRMNKKRLKSKRLKLIIFKHWFFHSRLCEQNRQKVDVASDRTPG